ncbi:MAG: hypothetical protein LJE84_03370 [Gammaproteobacteria bacterium]|jgi:hypothetical protein|nr:hypothetical protein [Gammaproteobacteria bacterium]
MTDKVEKLVVFLDGVSQVEFHRDRELSASQRDYLAHMDVRMDQGIDLEGERIDAPDPLQRATFVARTLVLALLEEDQGIAAAACSWLGDRVPELTQVQARRDGEQVQVELVFGEPAPNQARVEMPTLS